MSRSTSAFTIASSSPHTPASSAVTGAASRPARTLPGRPALLAAGVLGLSLLAPGVEAQFDLAPGGPSSGRPLPAGLREPVDPLSILRVNLGEGEEEANGPSDAPLVSPDGTAVVFSSLAANLVAGDAVGLRDVFVRDLPTGLTELVSVTPEGSPGNGPSGTVLGLSSSATVVAFDSWATDLVSGDDEGQLDVFVRDRGQASTERISVTPRGQGGNGPSTGPSVSADGRFVAFSSWADDLVTGDDNGLQDVFLRDRDLGLTMRLSETVTGEDGIGESHSPSITPDGRFVAFTGQANNLVEETLGFYYYIFVRDTLTGETFHVSKNTAGEHAQGHCDTRPSVSADGRVVAFATYAYNLVSGDSNWVNDIFVHDRLTGITSRVSESSTGIEADGGSIQPVLSSDGRLVAFVSGAGNLVSGDTNGVEDIFVHDRETGQTRLVTRDPFGLATNGPSATPSLSVDAAWLVFGSSAGNLVLDDGNLEPDVFLCALP